MYLHGIDLKYFSLNAVVFRLVTFFKINQTYQNGNNDCY